MNYTLCRLMPPDLPLLLEPERLARKGETVTGQYAIEELQRLEGLLFDNSGTVRFRLEFYRDDEDRHTYITGNIRANVNVLCQRCLQCMALDVESKVFLAVLARDVELPELPDDCEPLVTGNEPVSLQALIEDELILALPITVMHNEEHCKASGLLTKLKPEHTKKPFADLKNMIRNSRN